MKTMLSMRRSRHAARIGACLFVVAVIALVAGCGGNGVVKYDLTIASTAGGSTSPAAGTHGYTEGAEVDLGATAYADYRFANWTGDVGTIANVSAAATIIVMNDDYSITASFIKQYGLSISSTAGGSVTIPGEGSHTYDEGAIVNLAARGEEGYGFVNWTGDVGTIADAGAALTTITMNADYAITANFEELKVEELFAGGNGTEEHPYLIMNWHHLNNIRYFLSGHYILMNDLDSATAGYTALASATANGGMGWEPIGDYQGLQLGFTGGFDGQGHEIIDLFIDRPDEGNTGLFDVILGGAVVENVGIVNGSVTGGSNVGVLAGGSTGTISCSYSNSSVTGDMSVGGLVGSKGGTVSNSYVTGSVSGNMYVGGLVALNSLGTIRNCYSTAAVTGGHHVGGLVGDNSATVSDSFWNIEMSGQSASAGGTGKTTVEMQDIATFSGAGWEIVTVADPDVRNPSYIWNIVDGQTYPFLSWQSVS